MRDAFGTESPSEGSTAAPQPGVMLAPPAGAPGLQNMTASGPAQPPAQPTLQQSVDKAQAKATSDQVVATDPNAVHSVKLAATSPKVLGSTAAGAGIGMIVAGPPGAAVGALLGFVSERYQIGGGPLGKAGAAIKKTFDKVTGKVAPPAAGK